MRSTGSERERASRARQVAGSGRGGREFIGAAAIGASIGCRDGKRSAVAGGRGARGVQGTGGPDVVSVSGGKKACRLQTREWPAKATGALAGDVFVSCDSIPGPGPDHAFLSRSSGIPLVAWRVGVGCGGHGHASSAVGLRASSAHHQLPGKKIRNLHDTASSFGLLAVAWRTHAIVCACICVLLPI